MTQVFTLGNVIAVMVGASGWGAAAMKTILDLREESRKAREDRRKDAAEARASYEERSKRAEGMAPFILKLNSGEWLHRYDLIAGLNKTPSAIPQDQERKDLLGYPGLLEEIGALMLAGKFTHEYVYEHFGSEVLTTIGAVQIWAGEDPRYWKIFRLLAEAMELERSKRDTEAA